MCDHRAATCLPQTGGATSPTAAVSILVKPGRRNVALVDIFTAARRPKSARPRSGFSLTLAIVVNLGVFGIFADVFGFFVEGGSDKNGAAAA